MHESTVKALADLAVQCCCRYTNKGRAFNPFAPTIGDSLNTAFLSAVYATIESTQISSNLQFRLNCWSRSQVLYVLGDAGRSLVSGWGRKAPTHVQVKRLPVCLNASLAVLQACVVWYPSAFGAEGVLKCALVLLQDKEAACPTVGIIPDSKTVGATPDVCGAQSLNSSDPNPRTLPGGVVTLAKFTDTLIDDRTLNSSRVGIMNNLGLPTTSAGLNQASGTWSQCLQGYGQFTKNRICSGSW